MNFFAHVLVAAQTSEDPRFLLGAMLPDLVGMIGARIARVDDPLLAAGVECHHETDAAFHGAPRFHALCAQAIDFLSARGLARGSARAIGHVGVELLLDGSLADRQREHRLYREALEHACKGALDTGALRLTQVGDGERLRDGLTRLRRAPLPDGYRDPHFVSARLDAIVSRRPRLALRPGELAVVTEWACAAAPRVEAARDELLAQVGDGLARFRPAAAS